MNFDMSDFAPLGMVVNHLYEKTAAETAGETLAMNAYVGAFEHAIGADPTMDSMTKTASQQVGREIMFDFITNMLLDK